MSILKSLLPNSIRTVRKDHKGHEAGSPTEAENLPQSRKGAKRKRNRAKKFPQKITKGRED